MHLISGGLVLSVLPNLFVAPVSAQRRSSPFSGSAKLALEARVWRWEYLALRIACVLQGRLREVTSGQIPQSGISSLRCCATTLFVTHEDS